MAALLAVLAAALVLAPAASADLAPVGSFPLHSLRFDEKTPDAAAPPGIFAGGALAAAVNAGGAGAGASPGDVYVAGGGEKGLGPDNIPYSYGPRIQQFNSLDEFVRLWGPDVVKEGPGQSNEVQAVRVDATGGKFILSFSGETTAPLEYDADPSSGTGNVQAALNALSSIGPGGVSVAGGPGDADGHDPYLVSFDGPATAGTDQPQLVAASDPADPLSGGAGVSAYTISPGALGLEVCDPAAGDECSVGTNREPSRPVFGGALQSPDFMALDQVSGDLYVLEGGQGLDRVNQFSADGHFIRAWGWDVVKAGPDDSPDDPSHDTQLQLTVKADGGKFALSYDGETTAPLAYDVPASGGAGPTASVENALDALSTIGGNYSSVAVTGGPGNLSGSSPYTVTFHGLLGGDAVSLAADSTQLSASSGNKPSAKNSIVNAGGGFEICGLQDRCKGAAVNTAGAAGAIGVLSGGPSGISVAPAGSPQAGDVLVDDAVDRRVEEFTASGEFVRTFGWDVVPPGQPGNVTPANRETQEVALTGAVGGAFSLNFPSRSFLSGNYATTPPIPYDATSVMVQSALESVPAIGAGNVSVSGPAGGPWQLEFVGALESVNLENPDVISGGLTRTLTLTGATGGSFTFNYFQFKIGPVPYNASATTVQSALESFINQRGLEIGYGAIGTGNVTVTGPDGGPWQITFSGEAVTKIGGEIQSGGKENAALLTGPSPQLTYTIPQSKATTLFEGGAFEVCVAGESCQSGSKGANSPATGSLAGDSSGAIYTVKEGSVMKFTPAGGLGLTPAIVGTSEVQTVTVDAAAGKFRLSLPRPGGTTGKGILAKGDSTITSVVTSTGSFVAGQPIEGSGIPYGTYITAVGPGTITISQPRSFGGVEPINITSTSRYTTGDLPFDVPASGGVGPTASLQNAIDELPPIAATGGSVTVTGGPGGTAPYTITFNGGPLARTDPAQLAGSQGVPALSGGAATVGVATSTPGGPSGTTPADSPERVATGDGGEVYVSRKYPAGQGECDGGVSAPAELRLQELESNGTVVGTSAPCDGIMPQGIGSTAARGGGLATNPVSSNLYLLDIGDTFNGVDGALYVFGSPGTPPDLSLDAELSKIGPSGATISGTIDPHGPGEGYPDATGLPSTYQTVYRVEYKKSSESSWTDYTLDTPIGSGEGAAPFSVGVTGLTPKTPYELKVIATKPFAAGGALEAVRSFTTLGAPPLIASFHSSGVSVDAADLHARINPQGTDSSYRFEYGTTTDYGHSTPEVEIGDSLEPQAVEAHIEGLADTTYHFRVVATNSLGTTYSEDQTFVFHPPACPNQTLRQQTGASYLPDCRAYELVSPEDAGGTTFFAGGPQRPYATSPSRLAFVGLFGQVPGAGSSPINTVGDLYVATRGATGWSTRYIGPSSTEAACVGGRPLRNPMGLPTTFQNDVFASPDLSRLLDWNLGNPVDCQANQAGNAGNHDLNTAAEGSNSPYLWDAGGSYLGRWPTDLAGTPGAAADFACPQEPGLGFPGGSSANILVSYFCSTQASASGDLKHFVFSTRSGLFGQGGIAAAPGSAYDNDTATGALHLISVTPGGDPIPQQPGGKAGPRELIQFPHVSTDGSRILMGTVTKPPCRIYIWSQVPCRLVQQPTALYMRVDDAVSYEVSLDHNGVEQPVDYLGSTDDGTEVFFSTAKQMTADDTDTSTDLYMWDENGGAPTLTRLSAGEGPAGNTDNCVTAWTTKCGIKPYDDSSISSVVGALGGLGGWYTGVDPNPGYSDNSIAAKDGAVYFYSPEQLLAGRGVPGKENLYLYRDGALHFVAALGTNPYCIPRPPGFEVEGDFFPGRHFGCSDGPLGRLQVGADGRYAAFATTSRITPYDNAGHAEMYRFDADAERIVCVSCNPDGSPPSTDVLGSMGGRFLTDDGRVFFDGEEALQPRDTNGAKDTYEFVEGRPQLITSGAGKALFGFGFGSESIPGLYGVSADGTDAYFSTTEVLVGQDRNGDSQLKFYDARVNGGFAFVPPPPSCQAADECHGPSSAPPAALANGTGAALGGGGNVTAPAARKKANRCRKGAVKRKGRCVRKSHRAKRRKRHRHHRRGRGR